MNPKRMAPDVACFYTVLGTALAVVVAERVTAAVGEWSGAGLLFVLLALAEFGALAAFISARLGKPNWIAGAGIFAGVVVGVLLDVTLDWFLFSNDRNLFPFEIVFLWTIGLGPALVASLSPEKLDSIIGLSTPRSRSR